MRISICLAAFLALVLLIPASMFAKHVGWPQSYNGQHHHHDHERMTWKSTDRTVVQPDTRKESQMDVRRAHPLQVAGSRLPDCTHACGSCSPCRLVMVRFVCASPTEAEPCPVSYRCMCNGKSYPVP